MVYQMFDPDLVGHFHKDTELGPFEMEIGPCHVKMHAGGHVVGMEQQYGQFHEGVQQEKDMDRGKLGYA